MSKAVEKLAALDNIIIDVKVNQVTTAKTDPKEFVGIASINRFDPKNLIPNGGPTTVKGVSVQALGGTYDKAYENVLEKAVSLLGL